MPYSIHHIASIISTTTVIQTDSLIEHLLTDSRKLVFPSSTLFFALDGQRRKGDTYIKELFDRGVRNFVVKRNTGISEFGAANFIIVEDVLKALQEVAAYHRSQFRIPVIGITGSNGKTIVKEWLYQLLQNDYNIVRSPRSYNSQIGVPLSIWQMNGTHTLAIFEAGISQEGEMVELEKIIQPGIGILTNIGNAHDEGFSSRKNKCDEKFQLFKHAHQVIASLNDDDIINTSKAFLQPEYFFWGNNISAKLNITEIVSGVNSTSIHAVFRDQNIAIHIPFTDEASIQNSCTCWAAMLLLGFENKTIAERMNNLQPVEMRMQMLKAINNCTLLNDSYSNDTVSFHVALDYLQTAAGTNKKTIILSDFPGLKPNEKHVYKALADTLEQRNIYRFIGIGEDIMQYAFAYQNKTYQASFYTTTEALLASEMIYDFKDEFILLKGARAFAFERISKELELKKHQTELQINLTALVHNLNQFQQLLQPRTKVMAMVKAFAYGSGSAEVARVLQFHKVDYLAVAYADEGIDLRKAGISLPIIVMNVDAASFDTLIEYNLEPEVYSFNIYNTLHQYLLKQGVTQFPVHIKFNTGMNRLGFEANQTQALCSLILSNHTMFVSSVFSHLAASDNALLDDFTLRQSTVFDNICDKVEKALGYSFMKHLANSAAAIRHPELQYDMIRLGIGLYGIDSSEENNISLQTVATLTSTIAQIRRVKADETVGYNRKGILKRDSIIATIRIGYADGLSRRMSNGTGNVFVNGYYAPIMGSVCMDMCMIDITDIPNVQEEDEVEVFGKHIPIETVAQKCDTISYEILAAINQRVKRVYIEE